ncbi:MAG: type II secretion system protein [Chloroflexi bacterium]|nr:type II secretion system protein [Chloroflexota bacterium]
MIRDERGITVIELLVVLAITGLIIGTLATVIFQIFDITGWGNAQLVVQHDLRNAATWLNRDVLTASEAKVSGSQMILTVPYFAGTILTHTITYTFSAANGTLTRDTGNSSHIVGRHIVSNPFPLTDTIEAPNVVAVTLQSKEGDVPGSGTFALKMRAGGSIPAGYLCQVTGAENLGFEAEKVVWDITNAGDTSPTIKEIYVTWPNEEDENRRLSRIYFSGSQIWDGWEEGPSADIDGPWLPGGNRTIGGGTQKTLQFSFQQAAVNDEAQYSITITLTDNCTFSFPPNP